MNIPANQSHTTLSDYLFYKASSRRIPLSGGFELSPVCNFACKMCYVRKTRQEVLCSDRAPLPLEQWKSIARQARDAGMLYALLTGGEPLLWEDFWELYEAMVDMGLLVSINTNGSLIDDEAVRRLRRRPPRRVNVTLYGVGDDTYKELCGADHAFERVDRGIRGLQAAGINVKLNCSLTPGNVQDLEAIIAYAREHGLPLDTTSYMFPPIRRDPAMVGRNARFTPEDAAKHRMRVMRLQSTPERYRAYLEQLCEGYTEPPGLDESCLDPIDGKMRCRAGKSSFWITWDGWLMPCGTMPEPKVDLEKIDFTSGWKNLTDATDRVRLSGICGSCKNQGICHPCAAMAVAETGDTGGIPVYLCRLAREMQRLAREELENN